MIRLIKDKKGSAYLWAAFILLAMVMLAAVVYNGVGVYTKYQAAETELQRAVTVTVDGSMENAAVRDLVLDIPAADAEELFFDNLRELGYEQSGGDWTKRIDNKTIYSLTDLEIKTEGSVMSMTAVLSVPLLWETGGTAVVRIPIQARTSVLYIQP
ncbi:MAG: hypothetical protein A4E71_00006 [Smithella sp. PtaU1.Bin162]|nr:MAG: hypothetical protein A4E71_00006 [Smithella sp. PtaU1.Bin162]